MTNEELLEALDRRILDAINSKATGESLCYLLEARAWLTNPNQDHGSHRTNS